MDAEELVIGAYYLYEGMLVRLARTTRFERFGRESTPRTVAIIETPTYFRLWVKPEELEPFD